MRTMYLRSDDGDGGIVAIRRYLVSNLTELMRRNGLNQKTFAQRIRLSQPTVSAWMNEETFPTPENLERIAEEFECAPEDLIRDPNSPAANYMHILQDLERIAKKLGRKLVKDA
jgi:transcriptional regulator with XRE-family HTH domain